MFCIKYTYRIYVKIEANTFLHYNNLGVPNIIILQHDFLSQIRKKFSRLGLTRKIHVECDILGNS